VRVRGAARGALVGCVLLCGMEPRGRSGAEFLHALARRAKRLTAIESPAETMVGVMVGWWLVGVMVGETMVGKEQRV
jgi:hypothetical protein